MSFDAEFSMIGLGLFGFGLAFVFAAVLETLGVWKVSSILRTSNTSMIYLGVSLVLISIVSAVENNLPGYVAGLLFLIAALCLVAGIRLEAAARRLLRVQAAHQVGDN